MTIKSDKWIRYMAEHHGMLEPFEPQQVRVRIDQHGAYPFSPRDVSGAHYTEGRPPAVSPRPFATRS